MESFIFDIFLIIIMVILWIFRIKYLLIAVGGSEYDGRIVDFKQKGWSFNRGWGHMYSYIVQICIDGKVILSESVGEIFAPEKTKPDGVNSEITVIYNPQKDKCLISSFLKEQIITFILIVASIISVIAFIHDLLIVLEH